MTLAPSPGRRGDPTWLPEVLRAFGCTVIEVDGWKNRGHGDFDQITGVINHHTAGANTPASYIAWHPTLGLASQLHLARNGVYSVCGVGIAYHAGEAVWPSWLRGYVNRISLGRSKSFTRANADTIGIEAVNAGDGTQPWPEVQLDAYARGNAAICWFLGLSVDKVVLGHKEIAPGRKIDPNFDMNAMRRRTQAYIDNPPFKKAPAPAPALPTPSSEVSSMPNFAKLVFEQIAGFGYRNGQPTFNGWSVTSLLDTFLKRGGDQGTLPELVAATLHEVRALRADLTALKEKI